MVCVRVDIRIHTPRVGLKEIAVARAEHRQGFFGRFAQAQNSLFSVTLQRVWSNKFRKLSAASTPDHIHLPQPVLRRDVSLSEEQILEVRSFNRRYTVAVARH